MKKIIILSTVIVSYVLFSSLASTSVSSVCLMSWGISPTGGCDSLGGGSGGSSFCYCTKYTNACHDSTDLTNLRTCIENKMATEKIPTGTITTYQGGHSCTPSCHFGGSCANTGIGSLAVDYGLGTDEVKYGDRVIQIAKDCGSGSARCEEGSTTLACTSGKADHVHVQVSKSNCGCN